MYYNNYASSSEPDRSNQLHIHILTGAHKGELELNTLPLAVMNTKMKAEWGKKSKAEVN